MSQIVYTAHATAVGGREGHAETDDQHVSVDFVAPGSGKPGTNPEQLFACGYGACFGGALAFIARPKNIQIGTPNIKIDVNLHKGDNGFSLSAQLDVQLPPAIAQDQAEELVHATHKFCPYSKATRGNIDVKLLVNGQAI
jgi:osmotically inducible protein OsmC